MCLGMCKTLAMESWELKTRNRVAGSYFYDQPILKNFLEFCAAILKGAGVCPHTLEPRYFAKIRSVAEQFVAGFGHLLGDKLAEHIFYITPFGNPASNSDRI